MALIGSPSRSVWYEGRPGTGLRLIGADEIDWPTGLACGCLSGMVLPGWAAYRRPEDDELLGYLVQEPGGTVPLTLFGVPLGEAGTPEEAEAVLRARGLSCLADPWLLRQDDGEEVRVALVAAYPDRVVVVPARGATPTPVRNPSSWRRPTVRTGFARCAEAGRGPGPAVRGAAAGDGLWS